MSRTTRYKDDSGRWCGANTTGRDKKPANKPNSEFKKDRRRARRNKEKQAMRNGKEIPQFKNDDQWEWN